MIIKQSSTARVLPFLLVDSADHITGKTGLTPTVTLSKNGAAFGSPAGAVTETGSGWYKVAGNTTDTNTLGSLVLHASSAGADPADTVFEVVAFDPDSATNLGLSNLDVAVSTHATPAQVATELTTYGALKPTTAGRTLDVTATGEAGLDWANIGAPTTMQNLSATTISTSQVVASVTAGVSLSAGERTTLAGVIWAALTSGLSTVGSIGKLLVDNVNATISSRAVAGDAMTLTSGERTTLSGVIWNVLTSTLTTASTIGKLIVDNLNATVSSRATQAQVATELTTYGALKPTVAARTLDVSATGEAGIDWANVGSPTTVVGLSGTTIKAVTDPVTLTAAYDAAKTAATQASVNVIDDFLDSEMAAVKTTTDKLDTALELDGAVYRYTTNALEQAPTGTGGGGGATVAQIWDEPIAGHLTPGSTGAKLNAAASAGDPWATVLPGSYSGLMAGKIVGDNLNATVSSRATQTSVDTIGTNVTGIKSKTDNLPTDPASASTISASFGVTNGKIDVVDDFLDTEIAAIKTKTDQLTFTVANKVDATSAVAVADMTAIAKEILKVDWTTVSGEATYSTLNALRMLRNAWTTSGGTLTVKGEDGSTTKWTRTLGVDPTASPIVSST